MRITITGKVVLVFLLMAAALGVAIIFMSKALNEVGKSVGIVGEPNRKLQTWKGALDELNAASASLQRWKISRGEQELNIIDSCRQNIYARFDQLHQMNSGNEAAKNLTD